MVFADGELIGQQAIEAAPSVSEKLSFDHFAEPSRAANGRRLQ